MQLTWFHLVYSDKLTPDCYFVLMTNMKSEDEMIEDLITVGDLKRHLAIFGDDEKVLFGCLGLQFYRTKKLGDKLVQIEFNQTVWDDKNWDVRVDNH